MNRVRSKPLLILGLLIIVGLIASPFFQRQKRVLIIAPRREEIQLAKQFPYTCLLYKLPWLESGQCDLQALIDEITTYANEQKVQGLFSSYDYAGAALASICNEKLGFAGPTALSVLTCQHKYYSRCAQAASVAEATPAFRLGLNLPFPCFVKPVKSTFSRFARKVETERDISMPEPAYFDFFDQMIAYATPFALSEERRLAEELLQGVQVTWEGYIHNGKVETIGIVDSIMYPGTINFQRFDYPSQLPQTVQQRMEEISMRFLNHIGLNNTICNIEFMYDAECDRVSIIEVNPRMVLQFCDLYEKVDGTNSYEIALALATNQKPRFTKNAGKYQVAASFVLRRFEDGIAEQVPTNEEIEKVKSRFPDTLIFVDCKAGKKLSDRFQDGTSYRYGLIHLGASDKEDLLQRFEECKSMLTFTFSSG